jgi:hypothetical protein
LLLPPVVGIALSDKWATWLGTPKVKFLRHFHRKRGARIMTDTNRRAFLGGVAFATGGLAATKSFAADKDGHAAGYDVAPASDYVPVIPRRTGDPMTLTASLDKGAIKAASGGWARDITLRGLPIATERSGECRSTEHRRRPPRGSSHQSCQRPPRA